MEKVQYKKSDFYYDLPEELIAQTPIEPRNTSRLLKMDKITGEATPIKNAIYISAKENMGIDNLKKAIVEELKKMRQETTILVPYSRGDILSSIHAKCKVISEDYNDEGTQITFSAPREEINRIVSRLK